jgi:signal transduction histidine kinase
LGGRYWQVEASDSNTMARSRSLFDQELPTGTVDDGESFHWINSDGQHLILASQKVDIEKRHFRVTVGEDYNQIHQAGVQYGWDIARLFSLLGIAIVAAALAQLKLVLLPLKRLRSAVDDVRRGEVGRLEGDFPAEIEPLVDEVNELLSERETLAERGRRRASDLAHGLKTPLAALHGIAMRLRDRGEEAEATALDELAWEMSSRVDYQMRLASLRTRSGEHRESSSLNTAILRTVTVLRKTERGEGLHWMAELGDDLHVDIHRQDLMELVGVTLENASKWGRSAVVVNISRQKEMAVLRITDDGPGIHAKEIEKLGRRGTRLDEAVPGTGLGLAIATEILELSGGTIAYVEAPRGGFSVEMRLPLARR